LDQSSTGEPPLKQSLQSREDQRDNPTERRWQNTLAARRSRAKKVNETQSLREEITHLRKENTELKTEIAIWKERAQTMERLLSKK
jgi:predicted RNase H-like nuclease (RuvC/YqgF family)